MLIVDKNLFNKLPKYAQTWKWIQLQKGYTGFGIDAICQAKPKDINKKDVDFTCDNWTEFIWWVRKYNNELRRQHND
jgi:hypothetical protein